MPVTPPRSKDASESRDTRRLPIFVAVALGCGGTPQPAATVEGSQSEAARGANDPANGAPAFKPGDVDNPQVSATSATSMTPLRFRGQVEALMTPGSLWAPIVEATSGASGELRVLLASAPVEAPGPRLTILRFDDSGPDGAVAPTDAPRHPLVLSQPVLDDKISWREFRQFLSAPKTRSAYARPSGCEQQAPAEAYRALIDAAASLRDTRSPAQDRVDALATIVASATPDIAFSPPHLRRMLGALHGDDTPTIETASPRRATLSTTRGRWELLRRDCWVVSDFQPATPTPQR